MNPTEIVVVLFAIVIGALWLWSLRRYEQFRGRLTQLQRLKFDQAERERDRVW